MQKVVPLRCLAFKRDNCQVVIMYTKPHPPFCKFEHISKINKEVVSDQVHHHFKPYPCSDSHVVEFIGGLEVPELVGEEGNVDQ